MPTFQLDEYAAANLQHGGITGAQIAMIRQAVAALQIVHETHETRPEVIRMLQESPQIGPDVANLIANYAYESYAGLRDGVWAQNANFGNADVIKSILIDNNII